MAINNFEAFKERILMKLGFPIIQIEIMDEQIEICTEEALDYAVQWNDDFSQRGLQVLELVSGTKEYQLDTDIENVIYYIGDSTLGGLPSFRKLYGQSLLFSSPNIDLISYVLTNANLTNVDLLITPKHDFHFNRLTKKLTFLNDVPSGDVALYVFRNLKKDYIIELYNDIWFQKYVTSLCKIQWASNIGKYDKSFIGNATLNYSNILEEGKREKEELENEMYENRHTQPMFFVG